MNELLIMGIIGTIFILMFIMTSIIENLDAIGEWLFDLGCAYYKWKHHRKNKQYF